MLDSCELPLILIRSYKRSIYVLVDRLANMQRKYTNDDIVQIDITLYLGI